MTRLTDEQLQDLQKDIQGHIDERFKGFEKEDKICGILSFYMICLTKYIFLNFKKDRYTSLIVDISKLIHSSLMKLEEHGNRNP